MFFGLFNKEKALKKTIERANNSIAQSTDRWGAMTKLYEMGTEESLDGLCRRFSFASDKSIEDQDEKDWVVSVFVELADKGLPALRRYMKESKNLGYPLKILEQIATEKRIFEVIDELLDDEEPGYVRDPKRRMDIIEWLGAWDAPSADIVSRVLPYVEDFDENVRIKALETIALKPDVSAAESVCRAMVREEEESMRFQLRCAELLAQESWSLGSHKNEVVSLLPKLTTKYNLKNDTLATA